VAKKLGRRFIGIELEERYIAAARDRIAAIPAPGADAEVYGRYETRRSAPRIPFGTLLEAGLLLPGQTLCLNRRPELRATLLADGSLRAADGTRGSIHRIGALLAGQPACNGWEHWYYEDERGELVLIDALRERIRRERRA
jgi:hypothetical protein